MSVSQILSSTPAALAVSQLGVPALPVSVINAASSGLLIQEPQAVSAASGVTLSTTVNGADCSLYQFAKDAGGVTSGYRWVVGGTTQGGIQTGKYQLFCYPPGGPVQNSIRVGADGVVEFPDATQCGQATIPLLATTVGVPNTAVTANSVVLISQSGALNATATRFTVVLNPGVGFTITSDAAPTITPAVVSWFIARY